MYYRLLHNLRINLFLTTAAAFTLAFCMVFPSGCLAVDQPPDGCGDCHSEWARSQQNTNTFSPEVRLNKQDLCIDCHTSNKMTAKYKLSSSHFIQTFRESAHGKNASITCYDCHQTCRHGLNKDIPPGSLRIKSNVPNSCGKCHAEALNAYQQSIHGTAVAKNILDAPVCTDCHNEHSILSPSNASSSVAAQNIPGTCGACHEKEQLAIRYGFPGNRLSTYMQSYHGMANKLGEKKVANCISCHRYHDIYPSADPRSPINPANLASTCGKCHPGANSALINAKVHVQVLPEDAKGAWYVRQFYTYFIGILMALFFGYVFLDIYHKFSKSRRNANTEKDNV